jgi:DNA mismatch endonuclease, patch repair protein
MNQGKKLPPAPPASSAAARKVMKANRGRDTAPEVALRAELHSRGLRYRVHFRPLSDLRCEADIVFTRLRIAVFVDGCWWHGCPDHRPLPKANRGWWEAKIERNRHRDRRNDFALEEAGWQVIRIWEHEDPKRAAERIEHAARSESQ